MSGYCLVSVERLRHWTVFREARDYTAVGVAYGKCRKDHARESTARTCLGRTTLYSRGKQCRIPYNGDTMCRLDCICFKNNVVELEKNACQELIGIPSKIVNEVSFT